MKNTQLASPLNSNNRWWDWFAAVLLVLAVLTAVLRLLETKWSPELSAVQLIGLAGVIIGLALGQSIFSARLSFGLGWAYGLFIVLWQISLGSPKDFAWQERVLYIGERISRVLKQVYIGDVITDSIVFIILMAVLFWILSTAAGYSLARRGSAWWAILPLGMVMFVIHFYHNCPYSEGGNICNSPGLQTGATYIASYILFSLLLVGRAAYFQHLTEWTRRRIFVAPEVSFDLTRFVIGITLAAVLMAWFAPVAYAKSIPIANRIWMAAGSPIRRLNNVLSPLFESIRTAVSVETDDFGTQLPLGRGGALSDRIAMQIEVKGSVIPGLPYYWRNRVYDQYQDGGWQATITETQRIANESIPISSTVTGTEVRFTFASQRGLSILYTPTRSIRFSSPVDIERELYPDGTMDVTAVKASVVLRPGQSYQVAAQNFPVTIANLKEAGTVYPTWITERYLQVPPEITARTRALAEELAAGKETPYDVVAAVTTYLRENLEYSEQIPTPPENQEPLDWILFDNKEAFCNYYATAEIMLLRSVGIPARLVAGYAQGERQANPDQSAPPPEAGLGASLSAPGIYIVRSRDAHAWPEVYFPNIGWVEFEPTASIRAINRPSGDNSINLVPANGGILRDFPQMDDPTPEPFDDFEDLGNRPIARQTWWQRWGAALILGAVSMALVLWHGVLLVKLEAFIRRQGKQPPEWLRRWAEIMRNRKPWIVRFEAWLRKIGLRPPAFIQSWAVWANLSPIERAYGEVNKALIRLGHPPAVDDTPAERLANVAELLPEVAEQCRRLLTEYQAEIYSQHTAHPAIARWAADRIQKQSIQTWLRGSLRFQRNVPKETAAQA